jgi:hypothetical protein
MALAAALAVVLAVTGAGAAAAATAVYLDSPGWTVSVRDTGSLSIDGTYGAPAGFGGNALVLRTPEGNDKAQFMKTAAGEDLDAAMADVSYSTYRDPASTASAVQVPSINVVIDYNGAAADGFTTLVFEPVYNTEQGPILAGTWQSWDADGQAKWWSTKNIPGVCDFNCFVPLSVILAANPEATLAGFGVNQGGGNPGLIGASDALTINGETFDFEKKVTLEGKDQCKDGGWTTSQDPVFVNQGDCVSYFASGGKTHS